MSRLVIVTALMAEAVPIIDFYRLQKQPKRDFYHHFQSVHKVHGAELDLLVCGIGAANTDRGLGAYIALASQGKQTRWLNLGIAGALEFEIGELVWVSSIRYQAIGLPSGVTAEAMAGLVSLPQPGQSYLPGTLFDMEAETWLACIAENSQQFVPEHAFCAKVISDNPARNTQQITRHWVTDILRNNIKLLDECINNIIKSIE